MSIFLPKLKLFFSFRANKLFLVPFAGGRVYTLHLPTNYFFRLSTRKVYLFFTEKFFYLSFLAHFRYLMRRTWVIYFLRLRVRGLGYRIRRYTDYFYRFYFARTNYIYFHVPKALVVRRRKKKLFLFGTDYHLVRLVFTNLLLLHKVGPYNRRGFSYPRQIIYLKQARKIV